MEKLFQIGVLKHLFLIDLLLQNVSESIGVVFFSLQERDQQTIIVKVMIFLFCAKLVWRLGDPPLKFQSGLKFESGHVVYESIRAS